MERSGVLRAEDVDQIMNLAGELLELPPDRVMRTRHMLAGLCRLLRTDFGNDADTLDPRNGGGEAIARERKHVCAHYNEVRRPGKLDEPVNVRMRLPDGERVTSVAIHQCVSTRPLTPRERAFLDLFCRHIVPRIHGGVWEDLHGQYAGLSPRQRETLEYLVQGKSAKEIAGAMRLSRHTVNEHLNLIYKHYGVSGKSELLAKWLNNNGRGVFAVDDAAEPMCKAPMSSNDGASPYTLPVLQAKPIRIA